MWVFRISRPSVWNVRSKVYPTDLAPISHRGGSNSCLAFSVPELSVVFQPASLALYGTEDVVGGLLLSLALVLVSRRRVGLAGQAMGAGRMEGAQDRHYSARHPFSPQQLSHCTVEKTGKPLLRFLSLFLTYYLVG